MTGQRQRISSTVTIIIYPVSDEKPAPREGDNARCRPLITDGAICLCDAYAPDKRPGKCPIHNRRSP